MTHACPPWPLLECVYRRGLLSFWSVLDVVNLAHFCSLGYNNIGDQGAIGLGKGLEKNTGLTSLKYALSNRPKPPDSISRPRWATFIFPVFFCVRKSLVRFVTPNVDQNSCSVPSTCAVCDSTRSTKKQKTKSMKSEVVVCNFEVHIPGVFHGPLCA